MELVERVDIQKLYYLKSLSFSQFKQICDGSGKNEEERRENYEAMKNFCKVNLKTGGIIKRIYAYSADTVPELGGRLYCGGSIQGLPKSLRGFIASHTTDVDMKNAHPTILEYICHKHEILCPQLEFYNNHRDQILHRYDDREKAKRQFLMSVNDDKPFKTKDKFLQRFDAEMKMLQKTITGLEEYAQIRASVPASKRTNWNGSAINRILCMYENQILQVAVSTVNRRSIEICTPMFDGFMVYGDYYQDAELIDQITTQVNNSFPNLKMAWAYKAHDDSISIPEGFTLDSNQGASSLENSVSSDVEAAEKVFKLYPYWVYCKSVLYVFNGETGMWDASPTAYLAVIKSLSEHLHVKKLVKEEFVVSESSYGNTLSLMERIPVLIKTMCINDDWLKQTQHTSLGKLLFKNGYIDLREYNFYSKEEHGFNPEIVFLGRIHHNFDVFDDNDLAYIEDIKERFFYKVLGEDVGSYLIHNLSRGLGGDMMKRILFGLGDTNSGKSVLTQALQQSCGDYVGEFNAGNLAYRNTGQDEAQQLRWAMLLQYKRIIISNEIKSTTELDGNMIKKVSSGGDALIGRLHCANESCFVPHFLPIVLANDVPKIKPYDPAVKTRLRVVGYNKSFVENPTNEFELKRDDNIKNEINTARFQRCFVGMLIQAYHNYMQVGEPAEPEAVISAKQDWIEDQGDYVDKFLFDFEFTDNKADFVLSDSIKDWITTQNLGITMKKFGLDIKKHCMIHKLHNIKSDGKKINGRNVQVWFGIKDRSQGTQMQF